MIYDGTYTCIRPCPLCGASVGSRLVGLNYKVFDDLPITGAISLVVCECCGFAFTDTPNTQADFDLYYQQNSYYLTAATTGSGGADPHDIMRFEGLIQRLAPYIPCSEAAIIDVGCARGGLLNIIYHHGFSNLYGVDMLPECVEHVRNTYGFPSEIGSALELPFVGIRVDVLIYSHVVEHVINLSELVLAARERLSDEGVLYVEVPDASRYGECSSHPYQDLYLEHVNHFDLSNLVALFEIGGFELVSSGKFVLEAPPTGNVPCVWGVFRKGPVRLVKQNRALGRSLLDYLVWSRQHPAHNRFAVLAQSKTPLILWGVSQYAMLMLGQSPLFDCDVRGFVDIDPSKRMRTLLGLPIELPGVLHNVEPNHAVLVMAPGYELSIASALTELGFDGQCVSASGEVIQHLIAGGGR